MADLFNSEIGTASGVSANIPGGGIAAPTSVGGVIGNDYDAQQQRINDLTAANKAKVVAQHQAFFDSQQTASQPSQASLDQARLSKLATNLQSAYQSIDSKSSNAIEANVKKREARTAALIAAGKEGATYIKSFADSLETKEEVRPDGMINVLGANGEILAIKGNSKEDILAHKTQRAVSKVQEVFPNTVDTFDTLFQIDQQRGGTLPVSTQQETLLRLKNSAGVFKSISDDYHVHSQTVTTDQSKTLVANAEKGYIAGINNMMNTFLNPDIVSAVKNGTIDRSQMTLAMQQVRRDIMDEITTQHIPVNIPDIDKYISSTMDGVNKAYEDIQKNDLITIDQASKTLEAQNAYRQHMLEAKWDTASINAAAPHVDFMAKVAATQSSLSDSAQTATALGQNDQAAIFNQQIKGLTSIGSGISPVLNSVSKSMTQSFFNFEDYDKTIKNAKTKADVDSALEKLGRVTNTDAGWMMQPKVQEAIDNSIPVFDKAVEDGIITQDYYDSIFSQLGDYNDYARSLIPKTGLTDEQYKQQLYDSLSFWQQMQQGFKP